MIKLQTPLNKEDIKKLKIGDLVYLSGTIYTARDQAHKRLEKLIINNEPLPFDLNNSIIYYTGPTPTKPGTIIGSCGPTSSYRMDSFMDLLGTHGLLASIGKGDRSDIVIDLCQKHQMIYFVITGGIGAKISKCVTKSEIIAFEDLGTEAIRKLEVKDLPIIVAYDTMGNNIFGGNKND